MAVKLVPGFDGFYKVSDKGIVWTCRKPGRKRDRKQEWRKLNPSVVKSHLIVNLRRDGVTFPKYVHQVVLETFVGPCPAGMECRHLDGNPLNNDLGNIEWATYQVNQRDRVLHGTSNRGERCASAKLRREQVLRIRKLYSEGGWSLRRLADKFGVAAITIYDVVKRRTWRHL